MAKQAIYYITVHNENYENACRCHAGVEEGIVKGIYKLKSREAQRLRIARVQLFGSGAILRQLLSKLRKILAEKYKVASDVWSVTSYTLLRREAQDCERWNMLHPGPKAASQLYSTTVGRSAWPDHFGQR